MLQARVREAAMSGRRWKFWGWGFEGDGLSLEEERRLLAFYRARIGYEDSARQPPPAAHEVSLRAPRLHTTCPNDAHARHVIA